MSKAFEEGELGVEFRWRLENVGQDPFEKDAMAVPLHVRLNYGTADWSGFSLFVEYDYVADLGLDNYNEGGGNTPDRDEYYYLMWCFFLRSFHQNRPKVKVRFFRYLVSFYTDLQIF